MWGDTKAGQEEEGARSMYGQETSLCFSQEVVGKVGLPWWLRGKQSACNEGNQHLIPGQEDHLEEGMATHSNTLAERIPRTEEPGGL